jgi:toxin ParE1/3/4
MTIDTKYSPLALAQLDRIWDYGFQRFGENQADKYIDGLFDAIDEISCTGKYKGVKPRVFPLDMISDITTESIYFTLYKNEVIYLKDLGSGGIGVVSILGVRMDTPNRLKEILANP